MKHLIALSVTILSLTGCSKLIPSDKITSNEQTEMTFTVGLQTKVGQIAEEQKLEDLKIYIFDMKTEELEAITGGIFDYTNPFYSAKLPLGKKRIITLANMETYPTDIEIHHIKDLTNYNIGWGRLLSSGKFPLLDDIIIEFTSKSNSINIELKNTMSRICIKQITNQLSGPNSGKPLIVSNAFLSNLPNSRKVDIEQPHTYENWHNKFGRKTTIPYTPVSTVDESDVKAFGYHQISTNITYNQTYILPETMAMYTFQNKTVTDANGIQNGVFSPRFTRLVITTDIDNITYYYPINLTSLQPGFSYDINLTITRLGSDDPDTFNFTTAIQAEIEISPFFEIPGEGVNIEF